MRRGFASGAHAYANSRHSFSRDLRTARFVNVRTCHRVSIDAEFRKSGAILATKRKRNYAGHRVCDRIAKRRRKRMYDQLHVTINKHQPRMEEDRCKRADSDERKIERMNVIAQARNRVSCDSSNLRCARAIDPTANSRLIN